MHNTMNAKRYTFIVLKMLSIDAKIYFIYHLNHLERIASYRYMYTI